MAKGVAENEKAAEKVEITINTQVNNDPKEVGPVVSAVFEDVTPNHE